MRAGERSEFRCAAQAVMNDAAGYGCALPAERASIA